MYYFILTSTQDNIKGNKGKTPSGAKKVATGNLLKSLEGHKANNKPANSFSVFVKPIPNIVHINSL